MADDARYQITPAALKDLEAELEQLETVDRAEMAARIKTAREWGDLKENAEYHDAKNDQGHLETKILRIQDRIRNAIVVEPPPASTGVVTLGSTVKVHDEAKGKESTYKIVTTQEAAPADGLLGLDSPIAQAIVGASEGDVVQFRAPKGVRNLKVLSIS